MLSFLASISKQLTDVALKLLDLAIVKVNRCLGDRVQVFDWVLEANIRKQFVIDKLQ